MASPKGKTPWYRDPEKFEELQDKIAGKRRYRPRTTGDDGDELTESELNAIRNSDVLNGFDRRNPPTERMSAAPRQEKMPRYSKLAVPNRFNPITKKKELERIAFQRILQEWGRKEAAKAQKEAAETLVLMKNRPASGGKINIYTGPKNGKYIIKNGAKVYINTESLTKPKPKAKPKANAKPKPKANAKMR